MSNIISILIYFVPFEYDAQTRSNDLLKDLRCLPHPH